MTLQFEGENLNTSLEDFVESLPINGRVSLLSLLEKTGCPDEHLALIEGIRRLRNGFAHKITLANRKLIDVIKERKDKSEIIRKISWIENYDEKDLIKMYVKDGQFFRFGMIDGTLAF